MTEIGERVDGRIRDLAELCTRHGTPCADGLLAEIGRLRTENARLERRGEADEKGLNRWCNYQDRLFAVMTSAEMRAFEERLTADGWWNEPLCRHEGELERTEGDLGVAIREAARCREAVKAVEPWFDLTTEVPDPSADQVRRLIAAALDQRLTR